MEHSNSGSSSTSFARDSILATKQLAAEEDSSVSNHQWRRYGKERRRLLLEEDKAAGGHQFDLNYECRIQGYFALSEKVSEQRFYFRLGLFAFQTFDLTPSCSMSTYLPLCLLQIISQFNTAFKRGSDLEAAYVMGHRLIHFLSEALPRHPDYMKKEVAITRLREESLKSLVQIQKRLDSLALRIDEEQLNKYIMHDFDPLADDDSSTSSCSATEQEQRGLGLDNNFPQEDFAQWENFDGWSFDLPESMTSSKPSAAGFVKGISLVKQHDLSGETTDTSNETFSSSERSFEEISEEHMPIYDSFGLDFLKRIASEDVRYETDSEAVDSWAQESEIESATYSMTSVSDSYDPARIALKEILNKKKRRPSQEKSSALSFQPNFEEADFEDAKENQTVDFDLSPDSSYDSLEEEILSAYAARSARPNTGVLMDRVSL